MKNFPIDVDGTPMVCTLLNAEDPQMTGEQRLLTANDDRTVHEAIREYVRKTYWHMSPRFRERTLVERYQITLQAKRKIEVFNFWKTLAREQLEKLGSALAMFQSQLKDPRLFTLESIQIVGEDEPNSLNGESLRERGIHAQQRLELFPASFEPGKYRHRLSATWIEGAVIHAAANVCLEQTLSQHWANNAHRLGWDDGLPDLAVLQRDCPTPYAALQSEADRAECVVAYLTRSKLQLFRSQIMERVLSQRTFYIKVAPTDVTRLHPALPELPTPIFRLTRPT